VLPGRTVCAAHDFAPKTSLSALDICKLFDRIQRPALILPDPTQSEPYAHRRERHADGFLEVIQNNRANPCKQDHRDAGGNETEHRRLLSFVVGRVGHCTSQFQGVSMLDAGARRFVLARGLIRPVPLKRTR
jgi:hypothetical protein